MRQYSQRPTARSAANRSNSARDVIVVHDPEVAALRHAPAKAVRLIPPRLPTPRARGKTTHPRCCDPSIAEAARRPWTANVIRRWSPPIQQGLESSCPSAVFPRAERIVWFDSLYAAHAAPAISIQIRLRRHRPRHRIRPHRRLLLQHRGKPHSPPRPPRHDAPHPRHRPHPLHRPLPRPRRKTNRRRRSARGKGHSTASLRLTLAVGLAYVLPHPPPPAYLAFLTWITIETQRTLRKPRNARIDHSNKLSILFATLAIRTP